MCEISTEVKTKVCKVCGEEKPVKEFNHHGLLNGELYYDSKCKVCQWFKSRNILYDNESIKSDDIFIIDSLLNHKSNINDISETLNKSLYDVCFRIKNILKLGGQLKLPLILVCANCGKEYDATPFDVLHYRNCCCKNCSDNYKKGKNFHKVIGKGNCKTCNKEFDIFDNVPNQKFCSDKCKSKYYCLNDLNKKETFCSNCNKLILKTNTQIKNYKNNYCSLECELEFKHNQKWEFRFCEICRNTYECLKTSTQRFCCIECQGKWQSEFLIGENANGYNHDFSKEDRTIICEWCNSEFLVKPYEINTARFCSKKCSREWFDKVWCQQEEQKQVMRERAVYILENGLVSQTLSKPQVFINDMLTNMNINYINEKGFHYCVVDNYLTDFNLIIEVMGTYWHCDNRSYSQINYDMQVNRIRMDKIKHKNILNIYNIEILYLWEHDILNNPNLCAALIQEYIYKNGKLNNYHSFNYLFDNELCINQNIISPYMDWDIDDLKKIIDISVKEKMSHKQIDKWITFQCEYCGEDKEQLTSHYNKSEHHYCSKECSIKARTNRIKVHCNNCNKEIEVTQDKFKTNKRFFCNQNCQHEYQRAIGFKWDGRDLIININ